ncbi:MAG: fumarylacetoacetate hydrolase family protein [Muribaculaceae bacterium]|nr:fumarylacetoacetate hydrolase family protein [Muribaculaceae bacterium]
MKVIGFTGNYDDKQDARCYLMADSSVLYTGRPFFIPDFAQRFVAAPTIVVRTGRLGKCIAPKFAHRYWDAVTAGFSVMACQDVDGRMEALDRAFDGAAIVGDWVPAASVEDVLHTIVEVKVDDTLVSRHCLADMRLPLADALSAVSTRCSIKMGDLLFTGDAGTPFTLSPGMRLTSSIGDRNVLDVKVRL